MRKPHIKKYEADINDETLFSVETGNNAQGANDKPKMKYRSN